MADTFYMLIGEGAKHAETQQYANEEAAVAEGKILSDKDRRPFFVLQAIGKVEAPAGAEFTRFVP